MKPIRRIAAVTSLLLLLPLCANATSIAIGRMPSNVHVNQGRLVFCQPDLSLTIIEVKTGKVLVRDLVADCQGTFAGTGPLITLTSDRSTRVIDVPATIATGKIATRWQGGTVRARSGCRYYAAAGDSMLCAPDEHQVERHMLATGEVAWRYRPPNAVNDIAESGGRVVVAAGPQGITDTLVFLNLADGKQLVRYRVPPPEKPQRYLIKSVARDQVILTAGTHGGCGLLESRRIIALPKASGVAAVEDNCAPKGCSPGELCHISSSEPTSMTHGNVEITFQPGRDALIERKSKKHSWRALTDGIFMQAAIAGDNLVIVHTWIEMAIVEPIDIATGEPRWVYVFPNYPSPPQRRGVVDTRLIPSPARARGSTVKVPASFVLGRDSARPASKARVIVDPKPSAR